MKIFKGRIVILRDKTNSGIVLLEDGSETQSIKFPTIFNDRDEVEVSFFDDNPLSDIKSIAFTIDGKNYGFIKYYNQSLQQGEIIGTYPAAISNIKFNLEDNPKLFPTISNDIKRWVLNIENLIVLNTSVFFLVNIIHKKNGIEINEAVDIMGSSVI